MNEMKSLTLNGKTYDSFPDKKAVKTINGEAPDENGNVEVKIPEDDGVGLTDTARILLMTVLRNGVYTSDQSANLAALEEALKTSGGGGSDEPDVPDEPDTPDEPKTYTITNALTNCTNSNSATSIEENTAYTAVISAVDGYELQSVIVTMGGSAVTVTNGVISISKVTGNIVITAVATAATTETVEENLSAVWTSRPDKTTYEYSLNDMSGGSSQAIFQQQVSFIQSETSGGTLYVDVDTTKISMLRFRMFIWDKDGNPYEHSSGMGSSSAAPISGDLSTASMNNPGENDAMTYANGSWSYRIPDGCKVLLIVHPSVDDMVAEELTSAAKPIYAFVDGVSFKNEIVTAKVVKEV